jgi:CubicO group peptidase (beta-lactamase class C family)
MKRLYQLNINIMKKAFFLFLIYFGSLGLKGQSPDLKNLIDSIVKINVTNESPGLVVGVVKDGNILYKHTYGLANLDYRIPVTDSTVFNLCSVSKEFTAFLILMLEKEGKLNLDDTIQKYIPETKNYGHPITIRQLLHHTSGIPSSDNILLFAGHSLDMPWDSEDEFNMIQTYPKLNFEPNREHDYSNTGYVLLALIIEKVTGQSFSQYIKERIFQPLNMKSAVIYDSPGKIILNRASGYRLSGKTFSKTNTEGESYYGSTNVYVSVNDMINWSTNLITHSLGGKQLADKQINPVDTLNNGDTIRYTYGFSVWNHRGLKIVDHGGFSSGFRTHITWVPEAGLAVFVLSNNENIDPKNIVMNIVDWTMKDLLKPETKVEHKEIAINNGLTQLYEGSFIFTDGMVLKFDKTNDTLKLIIPGAPKFIMYPEKDNEFFLKDFDAQCTFVKDSKGKVNEVVWHQNGQDHKGVRYIIPKPLTQKDLQTFTGKYEIPELSITYPVTLKDNELFITLPKAFKQVNIDPNMKISHLSGDKFMGSLGIITFKRSKEGRVTGFVVEDIGRLKNIEFRRKN